LDKPGVEGVCLYSRYIEGRLRSNDLLLSHLFFIDEFG